LEGKVIEKKSLNGKPPTLEQRIVSALNNTNIGSEPLQELIAEVEAAAETAEQSAATERQKALDLTTDLSTTSQAIILAELKSQRYRAVLPKLRQTLAAVLQSENHDRWLARYARHQSEVDALAKEFAEFYPGSVCRTGSGAAKTFGRSRRPILRPSWYRTRVFRRTPSVLVLLLVLVGS
jgi:hypothetical protein